MLNKYLLNEWMNQSAMEKMHIVAYTNIPWSPCSCTIYPANFYENNSHLLLYYFYWKFWGLYIQYSCKNWYKETLCTLSSVFSNSNILQINNIISQPKNWNRYNPLILFRFPLFCLYSLECVFVFSFMQLNHICMFIYLPP